MSVNRWLKFCGARKLQEAEMRIELSEGHLRRRWSLGEFRQYWRLLGQECRHNRAIQTAKDDYRAYKIARDELFPLSRLLGHLSAADRTRFQLTEPGTSAHDAEVFYGSGVRHFEVKTTHPLWPNSDGQTADYGIIRRDIVRTLRDGNGLENFGPQQRLVLGAEFADPKRMFPKDRLLRAIGFGLEDSFARVRQKYQGHKGVTESRELLIYVFGLIGMSVSSLEFIDLVTERRWAAPTELFRTIHISAGESGQYIALASN